MKQWITNPYWSVRLWLLDRKQARAYRDQIERDNPIFREVRLGVRYIGLVMYLCLAVLAVLCMLSWALYITPAQSTPVERVEIHAPFIVVNPYPSP